MLKYFFTIKQSFYIKSRNGSIVVPKSSMDAMFEKMQGILTGKLIFPDGNSQAVNGQFVHVHYSGRPVELPSWRQECFLKDVETVPEGTELWLEERE
jgi:hypothetical protein